MVETKQEQQEKKKTLAEQKEQQQLAARQRRERMIEMDRVRASKLPKSAQQQQDEAANAGLLNKAQRQMNEQEDDVKAMNAMVLYSKVVTIRDK